MGLKMVGCMNEFTVGLKLNELFSSPWPSTLASSESSRMTTGLPVMSTEGGPGLLRTPNPLVGKDT